MTDNIPNQILQQFVNAHGYVTSLLGDHVVVEGYEPHLSAQLHWHRSEMVQLDVHVHLPGGREVIESFVGIGTKTPEIVQDAFESFADGSLHVILAAFFGAQFTNDECTIEEWELPSGRFRAVLGNAYFRGTLPASGLEMIEWAAKLQRGIKGTRINPSGPHWVRLYYAQMQHQTSMCEVLFDNETWDKAQQAMEEFPWIKSADFYSARMFMVLLPMG